MGPGKKPSKPGVKGECDVGSPKLTAGNTKKYTDNGKCACWWDITRNDCACCKKGVGAMQCGFPMHKFCYKKSDMGCPGVCNYKYTLSGKGYPCFSDHSNTDCAWCNKEGWQCEQNSITGPDSKKGSRCQARTNQKYCASQQGECNKGWSGNGIQCMDGNGTLSAMPGQQVEVTLTMTAGLYEEAPVETSSTMGLPWKVCCPRWRLLAAPALQTIVRPPMRSPRSESTRRRGREGEERVGFG